MSLESFQTKESHFRFNEKERKEMKDKGLTDEQIDKKESEVRARQNLKNLS